MKGKRIFITTILLISLGNLSRAQTIKTVDTLERSYQACLDKGEDMLGCSKRYYQQIDDLLNVVYQKLRMKMSPAEFAKLKTEQLNWLSRRDIYFKAIPLAPEEKTLTGEDKRMVVIDKKAVYVKNRIVVLLKK